MRLSWIIALMGLGVLVSEPPASAHDHGHAAHGGKAPAVSFAAGRPGQASAAHRRIAIDAQETATGMAFTPAKITVRKGETIEFVVHNIGQLEHEFVLGSVSENAAHAAMMATMPDMEHRDANAVRMAPGQVAKLIWQFSNAGDFEFACLIPGHYQAGMKGEAVVK